MPRFLSLAPALLAGVLVLRLCALWGAWPVQPLPAALLTAAAAVAEDLLVFVRSLPLLCLLSLPVLWLRSARARGIGLAVLWSAWLAVQIALEQYFATTRVPLGADLFGYSWQEIATTVAGGARLGAGAVAGWLLPIATLCLVLYLCARRAPRWRHGPATAVLLIGVALWWCPLPSATAVAASEDARNLVRNKLAFFAGDSLRYWRDDAELPLPASDAVAATPGTAGDPEFPFLHREQTPDSLGPHFTSTATPPHLVFIIVEGLGRSFSGPDTLRGSFTPFLDELGGRSLYWSNFLANQGRTFGVLPSVFGSLPFADKGFAALGERMPAHAGLFNVLARQGYATRFYAGTDLAFDNERAFLHRQGVQKVVDLTSFGAGYRRNPYSSWGYDDSELVARVLADGAVGGPQPTVTVIQTVSMHTSYRFAGQDAWKRRFEQRLDELGVSAQDKAGYREFADIYSTILFTDDALRRYFDAAQRDPGYANTVFVVTGDHRLPELPMDSKIERYHVPLIVFSPRLKRPQRIRAVSSHLDITPSLLAFLAHQHGLQRPAQVAWTGRGLDTAAAFDSRGEIPLKHEKTTLSDFVAGPWFISHDQLYRLEDNLRLVATDDAAVQAQVAERFARYRRANALFAHTLQLSPEGAAPRLAAYAEPAAPMPVEAAPQRRSLYAHDVVAPAGVDAASVEVAVSFTNATDRIAGPFVPLLVLGDEAGNEVRESYAAAVQLAPRASARARFQVPLAGIAPGRYVIAVMPSHPDTGRRVGEGVYRVPIKIRCCAPGGGTLARP
ncbi:LTA synthase family protein [Lysobacter solisilvae (ex Woo and Kim 2020)]|uniref:LTA synthase family protein n=1 Tax=Agrilutibacter terrestris TaxID=2865112 RepID=A0A7H0G0P9_9GAMM|nr:LTA synthase family protein [Lysobacter terrestris]QNP41865.1 LTA synthase family protein [Lysobacter terrestris]